MHMYSVKLHFIKQGKAKLLEPLNTIFGDVHKGFETDGFSIPWYVRWFHNPFGQGLEAAIWHDFALKTGRQHPHAEFLQLLLLYGVPFWKAYPMWFFVSVYSQCKRLFKGA